MSWLRESGPLKTWIPGGSPGEAGQTQRPAWIHQTPILLLVAGDVPSICPGSCVSSLGWKKRSASGLGSERPLVDQREQCQGTKSNLNKKRKRPQQLTLPVIIPAVCWVGCRRGSRESRFHCRGGKHCGSAGFWCGEATCQSYHASAKMVHRKLIINQASS